MDRMLKHFSEPAEHGEIPDSDVRGRQRSSVALRTAPRSRLENRLRSLPSLHPNQFVSRFRGEVEERWQSLSFCLPQKHSSGGLPYQPFAEAYKIDRKSTRLNSSHTVI